jgi:hypothetical protein
MSFPVVEFYGNRHPLAQGVVGIGHDDAQAIDQVGTQVRRFNGFRREFGGRETKPILP